MYYTVLISRWSRVAWRFNIICSKKEIGLWVPSVFCWIAFKLRFYYIAWIEKLLLINRFLIYFSITSSKSIKLPFIFVHSSFIYRCIFALYFSYCNSRLKRWSRLQTFTAILSHILCGHCRHVSVCRRCCCNGCCNDLRGQAYYVNDDLWLYTSKGDKPAMSVMNVMMSWLPGEHLGGV